MKKSFLPPLAAFSAAAAALRLWQRQSGFESTGLAVRGNLPGLLLPAVLLLSACCFLYMCRSLPKSGRAEDGLTEYFAFRENQKMAVPVVAGAFLIALGAGTMFFLAETTAQPLLAIFAAAAAVSVLYTVFGLYRGAAVASSALLVPVCCAGAFLFWAYRTDASDPVLQAIYIRILAASGLTYSAAELVSFAFRNGSPRRWARAALVTVVLCSAGITDGRGLAATLFYAGGALIELGFLLALRVDGPVDTGGV